MLQGVRPLKRFLWQGRFGPAFWTTTDVISLVINIILIVTLVLVARQLFDVVTNFAKMDQATIKTVIPVDDSILVKFDLPVETTVPIHLNVAVNIPLSQTELHQPFVGLQDVVSPYQSF
jgi:hypothetical protein